MVLRHLRYFLAVAEEGTIAGAAARLHIAQPALSRQIHDFETTLQATLFERSHHGVTLTAAGRVALRHVRSVLNSVEDAIRDTRRAAAGMSGTLRIAVTPYAVSMPIVPQGLGRLRTHWPDVRIESVELQSDEQIAGLRAGDFDVAIGLYGADDPDGIVTTPVAVDAVNCAILAEDHPLAAADSLSIEQLRHERLLYYDRGVSRILPAVTESIERCGLQIAEEHHSMGALHWHVAARRGWTLGMSVQRERSPIGTVAVPLRDFRAEAVIVARSRAGDSSTLIRRLIAALRGADESGSPEDVPAPAATIENVELRQLRALSTAARERSLSRAAERIGITQSGLSRQIAGLEQAVGARLLDRLGTAAVPTIAGRVFAEHAERLLVAADEFFASVRAGGDNLPGRCRLGIVPTARNQELLLSVLRSLAVHAPTLTVDVTEMLSPEIERRLIAGEIDVGIASLYQPAADPALCSLVLEEDAIACALLPLNHGLAGARSIRAAQLVDDPFLFFARSDVPTLYDRVQSELALLGLRLQVGATASGPRAVRGMVAGGMGWTLGLRSHLQARHADVAAVSIEGLSIRTATELLWRQADDRRETLAVIDACRGLARVATAS